MDITKLLSLKYLFNIAPGSFAYMPYLIGFFIILLSASFYIEAWVRRHPNRAAVNQLLPKLGGRIRLLALLGLLFLWIRYENLPYMSMRVWLLALLLYIVWMIGHSIYLYQKRMPTLLAHHANRKSHNKYLPRKKR